MAEPETSMGRPKAYGPAAIALAALAALAVIALGVVAGRWQHGRYEDRAEAVRAFEAAQQSPAMALGDLVAAGDPDVGGAEWRTVTAQGRFDEGSLTALRGRSVDSVAALHYLAWFSTAGGPVLVDLGWAPRDHGQLVALPGGELTIQGILREQEADDGRRGEGATRITGAQMPAPSGAEEALPGWVMLREPCEAGGCLGTPLQPAPLPQLSLGPHLSYAYQWWLLALLAPFAAVYLLRRDARLEREAWAADRGDIPPDATPPSPRVRRAKPARLSDEEIEDAL